MKSKTARNMERVMGIEPTLFAWEAKVLPLNYTRLWRCLREHTEHQPGVNLSQPQSLQ